jgi:hypothetical protein
MQGAKTKAGGGSGIHRLAAARAKGTIRPEPKPPGQPAEKYSTRGNEYATKMQSDEIRGDVSPKPLGRKRGGSAGKWIQSAIQHPGALHKELHVPAGQKIPAKKLQKAAHSDNPLLRKRAALAKTLKGLHR